MKFVSKLSLDNSFYLLVTMIKNKKIWKGGEVYFNRDLREYYFAFNKLNNKDIRIICS